MTRTKSDIAYRPAVKVEATIEEDARSKGIESMLEEK